LGGTLGAGAHLPHTPAAGTTFSGLKSAIPDGILVALPVPCL